MELLLIIPLFQLSSCVHLTVHEQWKKPLLKAFGILWQKDAARVAAAAAVKGKADGCVEWLERPCCGISQTLGPIPGMFVEMQTPRLHTGAATKNSRICGLEN